MTAVKSECLLDSLSSSASCSFESISGDKEGDSDSTIISQPSPTTRRANEDASLAQVSSADFLPCLKNVFKQLFKNLRLTSSQKKS